MNLDEFALWERKYMHQLKVVVHFDYDGTLAEWKDLIPDIRRKLIAAGENVASIEDIIDDATKLRNEIYKMINEPGYYYDLMPYENVVGFAGKLKEEKYDTRLLSCVVSEEAKEDKEFWINDFCAGIFGGTKENPELYRPYKRVYVPDENRSEKFKYIEDIQDTDKIHILIDDHTPNCIAFEEACKEHSANGFAIKMFNGINGKTGRWEGFSLSNDMNPKEMIEEFKTIETFIRLKAGVNEYPGNKDNLRAFINDHLKTFKLTEDDIKEFYKNDRKNIIGAMKTFLDTVNEAEQEDDFDRD